jgi:hypothetical protein
MRFVVRVTEAANRDAVEAARWYEDQSHGLGECFTEEFAKATAALTTSARHHSFRFADVRRADLHAFENTDFIISSSATRW